MNRVSRKCVASKLALGQSDSIRLERQLSMYTTGSAFNGGICEPIAPPPPPTKDRVAVTTC